MPTPGGESLSPTTSSKASSGGTGGTRERSRQVIAARLQHGEGARGSVSPAVDGGPEDGPKNVGAGSDGSEPEGGQPHWRSQSGPGPPIDPPPHFPVLAIPGGRISY